MAINYKPVAKVSGLTGKKLYYPSIVRSKKDFVDTDEIARKLAEFSSVDVGSVFCVLKNLPMILRFYLSDGKGIRLEGLGSFFPTLDCKGNGVDSPGKVNAKQIKKVNLMYRPEYKKANNKKRICALTDGYTFERSDRYPWHAHAHERNNKE